MARPSGGREQLRRKGVSTAAVALKPSDQNPFVGVDPVIRAIALLFFTITAISHTGFRAET